MPVPSALELPVAPSVPAGLDWIFNRPIEPKDNLGVFDFRLINRQFLDNLSSIGEPQSPLPSRTLLPTNYTWVTADNKQRIPVALCEFAAYKSALAYEEQGVIARNLGNAGNFAFFDSNRKPTVPAGKLDDIADTQGFGFTYDGMVFVVLRGTEIKKKADRLVDIEDTLTDAVRGEEGQIAKLQERYGLNVVNLLPEIEQWTGLHLGFAIAWGAIADQVAAFLQKVDPNNSMPIIFAGHSLGGALALVGASMQAKGRVGAVITFGAPLVGNENFKARYTNLGLDPITLRFEAYGDSVPRIMRSWFYGLHLWLRTLILTLANPAPIRTSSKFKEVGAKWGFSDVPPLTAAEIVSAVKSIQEAARKKEEGENTKPLETKSEAKPPSAPAKPSTTDASGPALTPQGSDKGTAKKNDDTSNQYAAFVILTIVAIFVVVFLLIFARYKLACHAISERYALYLSTLSYQKIRALRVGETGTTEEKIKRANEDLDKYLRFIRGDTGGGVRGVRRREATYYKDSELDRLPLKLDLTLDLQTFTSIATNML